MSLNSNGAVNSNNWHHQTELPAGGSWFNGEIQHYTNRIENSVASKTVYLKVIAKKETFTDQKCYKRIHFSQTQF
jgi:hypothetical protein